MIKARWCWPLGSHAAPPLRCARAKSRRPRGAHPLRRLRRTKGSLTQVSPTEIDGYYDRTNGIWGGPTPVRTFFVIMLDKPASKLTTYQNTYGSSGYITFSSVTQGEVVQ
jgi:hypothetical protein